MKPHSRNESGAIRTAATVSSKLEKGLRAYIAAASAAGLCAVASPQFTEAEVVYTPANVTFGYSRDAYNLDLNHDGITDFMFSHEFTTCTTFCSSYLNVWGLGNSNANVGLGPPTSDASALPIGAQIGSKRPFNDFGVMARVATFLGSAAWSGQWADSGKGVQNRYLGLKFAIDGEIHYGWARLTVATTSNHITATLTGYAYETVVNFPIRAGVFTNPIPETAESQSGSSLVRAAHVESKTAPATLGALARGAAW